jgi:hypothetical protein
VSKTTLPLLYERIVLNFDGQTSFLRVVSAHSKPNNLIQNLHAVDFFINIFDFLQILRGKRDLSFKKGQLNKLFEISEFFKIKF